MASTLTDIATTLDGLQTIYVLLGQQQTPDTVAAALALSSSLKSLGKTVFIASPKKPTEATAALAGADQISQTIGNRNLVITLQLANTDDIDKVSYNVDEEEKTFNLIIQPRADVEPIPSDNVQFTYSGAKADAVILVGANSFQDLGFFYEQEKKLFDESTTIAFTSPFAQKFATHSYEVQAGAAYSEAMYEMLQTLGATIEAAQATNLLSGIDITTNNLQSPQVSPATFEAVAGLLRAGGKRGVLAQSQAVAPTNTVPATWGSQTTSTAAAPAPVAQPLATDVQNTNEANKDVPKDWLKQPKVYKGNRDGGGRKQ